MKNPEMKIRVNVDAEYPMDCIAKMGELIKDLSRENRDLYIQNKRLIEKLECKDQEGEQT